MKKLSIEYAHIYTNRSIEEEHQLSLALLADAMKDFTAQPEDISLVVMVDDYSFPDPTFDYSGFASWLESQGYAPKIMMRESQLVSTCDEVLASLPDSSVKREYINYVKAKQKYPCSLFIAAWYLLRLGRLKSDLFSSDQVAERLLNILPESFKPFEDKGLEIIAASPYADCVKLIEYRFISGRLIA